MLRKYFKKNIWYYLTHSFFFLIVITLEVNTNIFAQDSTETIPTDTTRVEESQLDTVKSNKKAFTVVELPNPTLDPSSLDFKIFTSINYNRNKFKNDFFPVFDNSMEFMALYMPVSMFSYGRIYDKTYEENTGYLLAASIVTNTAVTFATKMLVKRKRVRVYNVYYGVYPKTYAVVDPYSFPSGHTSTVFSLATIFALRYPQYPHVYIPIYTWAVIIGYGRIYLGMHYPSDVIVGALIGTGSSILIHSLRKEFFKFKNNVLGENKNDESSINGGVLTIFTAGFLTDILLNQFIFKSDSKVTMNTSPLINNSPGFGININYKF